MIVHLLSFSQQESFASPGWKIPQFADKILFQDGSKVWNRSNLFIGGHSFGLHFPQPEFGDNGGYEHEHKAGAAE
jgi:hypothetical protein